MPKLKWMTGWLGLLSLAGCAATEAATNEDAIGAAPASPAQASTQRVVRGADLASAFVTADRDYVAVRDIGELSRLGGLSGARRDLALRIDAAVATGPADGKLVVDELVRIERPDALAGLTPAERALLPDLWKLFELEPGELAIGPAEPTLLSQVNETFDTPRLDPRAPTAISALDAALQPIASRIQLVHDSDQDPSTVTIEDVDAMAAPGATSAFLPEEVARFPEIRTRCRASSVQALGAAKYALVIPEPFERTKAEGGIGPVTFSSVESFAATEDFEPIALPGGPSFAADRLHLSHDFRVAFQAPPGTVLHLVSLTSVQEYDVSEGNLVTGNLEIWQGGARVAQRRLRLGGASEYRTIIGHANPVATGNKPLYRVAVPDRELTASFALTPGAPAYDRKVPSVTLRAGTYAVADFGVDLEVYPDGVLFVKTANGRERLASQGVLGAQRFSSGPYGYDFDAVTSKLSHSGRVATVTDADLR